MSVENEAAKTGQAWKPGPTRLAHEAALRRTEALVTKHFPRARRCGNGWTSFCPAHTDRRSRSLSIGVGANGKLLLHCFRTCTFSEIIQAAGLRGVEVPNLTPPERSAAEMIVAARRIWEETRPLAGTVAERYLRELRGISITASSLRFHPHLASTELREIRWPTLVAGIQSLDGGFAGVQVTYLANDGSGKVPAFLDVPPRKIFGRLAGGAVRLAPAGETLVLAEGTETGLSIMQATCSPVWVSLGCNNLKCIQLPPMVKEVVIAADNDPAGIAAAECARQRFVGEGRRVRVVLPTVGNDFNEMVS